MRIAVVGAGVAGLVNAFELSEAGHEVTIFERADRAGGNIRTEREDGYTVEWGPNGWLDNVPETPALVSRLGMEERVLVSSDAARIRFIFRKGHGLVRLPEKPPSFFTSPLLSPLGRARVLLEPLARSRPRHDESVRSFAARRIGPEAADVLVQAMVSGVYAGDAGSLSLRSTFPKMYEMERAHGGLLRALIARRKAGSGGGPAGPGGTLTSFRGGMTDLVEGLLARLGGNLRGPVETVERSDRGYRLSGSDREFAAVILASPAWQAARILRPLSPPASAALAGIPGSPVTVVATAYDEAEIGGPPAGFGFLAPRGQGLGILGCLWTSSIYPGARAPEGRVLLRTMVGGALDPDAADLADSGLLDLVARDLRVSMGLTADPVRHWIFRHPRGIPQYVKGHGARLAAAGRALRAHPGIGLAGNSYRGISVNAVIAEARTIAAAFGG